MAADLVYSRRNFQNQLKHISHITISLSSHTLLKNTLQSSSIFSGWKLGLLYFMLILLYVFIYFDVVKRDVFTGILPKFWKCVSYQNFHFELFNYCNSSIFALHAYKISYKENSGSNRILAFWQGSFWRRF